MEGTDYIFDLNDRVRLKDIDTSFYGDWACVGNEAIITARRKDKYGLPEVYVEWDKNHWSYNSVRDGWTFQEHFELVERNKMGKFDDIDSRLDAYLNSEESKPTVFDQEASNIEPDTEHEYQLSVAHGMLDEAEAFITIAVIKQENSLKPVVITHANSPEGELAATAATSQFASMAHQELVVHAIQALQEKK